MTDNKHYKEQASQYSKTINERSPKTPAKTRFSQYENFNVELELRERVRDWRLGCTYDAWAIPGEDTREAFKSKMPGRFDLYFETN